MPDEHDLYKLFIFFYYPLFIILEIQYDNKDHAHIHTHTHTIPIILPLLGPLQ